MEAEAAAPGLWAAQQALLERLQGNPSKASSSSIRESVVVGGEREHEPARDHVPLCWLRAQATRAPSLSRCFFRLPDGSYAAGGVGVAHLVEGAGMIDPSCKSSNLHAGARYIGGCRFDPGAVSEVGHNSCWSGFGRELGSGHLFMLPLVEVQWLRGRLTLAVNLRWELGKSTRDDVVADAISALRMLNFSCPIPRRGAHCPCPLPPPVGESDGTSRTEWGESVSSILGAISKGVVQKAVLARQHQLRFAAPLESMDLLWNLRNHPGYLFMLQPGAEGLAFLGVSPERLFRWGDGELLTEALAGTRARGQTEDEDAYLAEELLASAKDASENDVTLAYIEECLRQAGLVVTASDDEMHILKLKHVLHLRREILAVQGPENHVDALSLLHVLHPTPAVCGSPLEPALALLRQLELLSGHLDRGFYAGPFGFMEGGGRNAEFCVAIRSALLHHKGRFLSIFAGAGIVNGSTAEGEWEETGEGAKMKGFTSLFESRCDTIVQSPNINTAWGALAVAELVRCGVSTFCVCPGSRSTPITVAIARHPYARSIVHHDERGAAFFAVGFARATGKPCAVVTSSGTAVANLLPGLIEAEVAGLPAIFITADRPPEMRDRGCNQTINQVGIFGHHARWFADMPCPDDAIPVESILSDICYSVAMANGVVGQDRASAGPVHINFMFRENLAPEAGPVRDSGNLKLSSEWDRRCFEGPAISRWLLTAEPITSWTDGSSDLQHMPLMGSILRHISCARNGLIVVGDLKKGGDELSSVLWLAQKLQWPIFADIASGLRSCLYSHGTGIGAYEALLREPLVAASLLPDVVLQLGRPLVSKVLQSSMAKWAVAASAVIMVSSMDRRHDPERCISHHLVCSVSTFVKAVAVHSQWAEGSDPQRRPYSSSRLLKPLRKLSACIDTCWTRSLNSADTSPSLRLSEPMIARIVSEMLPPRHGLFLSNSMPCRDMDAFASMCSGPSYLTDVALNRGASGIDGVISSAIGYACGLGAEVTLVIGDMAVLHDIGSLHILSRCPSPSPPLCIICVNNGGGGIFSFLPIAKREHADVFSPFFDTPHDTSFAGVCHSFGLQYFEATSGTALRDAYEQALVSAKHTFIEAFVPPGGEKNVQVHKELYGSAALSLKEAILSSTSLSWTLYPAGSSGRTLSRGTILFLHGFMGSTYDWESLISLACQDGFACLAVDLPGHGGTRNVCPGLSPSLAGTSAILLHLLQSLRLDATNCWVVGYSMGGRVALAAAAENMSAFKGIVDIGGHPGLSSSLERFKRLDHDRATLKPDILARADFVKLWYGSPLWANIESRRPYAYQTMMEVRTKATSQRADAERLSEAALGMSLGLQPNFRHVAESIPTLFISGSLDDKYVKLGKEWASESPGLKVCVIPECGHAVTSEAPGALWKEICSFCEEQTLEQRVLSGFPVISTVTCDSFAIPLTGPLHLSTGTLTHRRVVIVSICAGDTCGVGELSPLPGFHPESLEQALEQLDAIGSALIGKSLPSTGSLVEWIEVAACHAGIAKKGLHTSVVYALETAALHLSSFIAREPLLLALSRRYNMDDVRPMRGTLYVNSLMARSGPATSDKVQMSVDVPPTGPPFVTKVKVGSSSGPLTDAARVCAIAAELSPGSRLRLDANQAWSHDEAVDFCNALPPGVRDVIDYIEEPISHPELLPELHKAWLGKLRYALDESTRIQDAHTQLSVAKLISLKEAGCSAIVIKPTLQPGGLKCCIKLAQAAGDAGISAIFSSTFESSVGLSHLAILAAFCCREQDVRHGLGTYTWMNEEEIGLQPIKTLMPGAINTAHCAELLNDYHCKDAKT